MAPEKSPLSTLTRVNLTNLGREMYPALHVTKQEVITYYIRMAPRILPFVHNRPLTMHRYPGGVGGENFYEKDAPQGTPDYVDLFTRYTKTADREVHFVLCNNLDTLIWLANLASLELHVTLSTAGAYDSPDLLLFDIDPEPPLTFDETTDVALIVHERLEEEGIRSYVKTSGKKGLHIVVPLSAGYRFDEIRTFAHTMGKTIARDTPHVVAEFPHSRDPGTIFIDYLQNAHGKTMAAPYSLRATDTATVSAPLSWDQLRHGVRPEDFNIRTMLSGNEDPWRGIFDTRQTIRR
ncbi:MAG: non-homologous end-joining DNA ligase [Methanoregula sp.]|nr:non-homologous end-joining DNA ligase [Methanoregula sp.]